MRLFPSFSSNSLTTIHVSIKDETPISPLVSFCAVEEAPHLNCTPGVRILERVLGPSAALPPSTTDPSVPQFASTGISFLPSKQGRPILPRFRRIPPQAKRGDLPPP